MTKPMNTEEILSLQNDLLQVRILPAFGGKISSLRSVRTGVEFLLPPLSPYRSVSPAAKFYEGDKGGFDECLPTVSSCESIGDELPAPDHGDLWRRAWHVDSREGGITLHADAQSRPLRLTRRASLEGATLLLDYHLHNRADQPATWLWSAHPLLSVEAGDRVVLPCNITEVSVHYSSAGVFERGTTIAWPHARSVEGAAIDLSHVGEQDGVTAHKLFARDGQSGWCALYRHKTGRGLVLRFDPSALPFLGLWLCSGAWPETDAEKQYAVALEPTTSDDDSLASAERKGTARRLGPGESYLWRVEFEVLGLDSPLSYEDFCAKAGATPSI